MNIVKNNINIIKGDLKPAFTVTLKRKGKTFDISGYTITMIVKSEKQELFSREVQPYEAENSRILVQLEETETDVVGHHKMYFQLDDGPETYPTDSSLNFNVFEI